MSLDEANGDQNGDGIPLDVLGAQICGLAARLAQATHRWLAMIEEFDRRNGWVGVGIKSCAHWLAWTCSMAPGTAREHIRVARSLATLPLVSSEMAEGRLSYAKVREITRMTTEPDRLDEPGLVELARTATASQLARSVRAFRKAAGMRGHQEIFREVRWHTAEDGSLIVAARLPAEEGAVILAALEAARDDLKRTAGDVAAPVDRADMLLHLARGYLSAAPEDRSGEDRTMVVVHVNAAHLDSGGDAETRSRGNAVQVPVDCCEIRGVGGIEPATARRLACDATLVGIIRGVGGATLAHGRRRRLVSPAQRRALQIRDGGCQFPSCQRVSHLEAHHVKPWSHGGATDMHNLILLCRFHHVACHEGGVQVLVAARSTKRRPQWYFVTAQGDPLAGSSLPGDPDVTVGWRGDNWILRQALDGSQGWHDPDAAKIRPLWAGETFSLADTVAVLFAIRPSEVDRAAA